jgi:predicted nucleic acid-binding Zn ribbon protein
MDLINRVIQQILGSNQALKSGVQEARILDLWAPSVGEQISKHAKAVQLKDSTLFVVVDHPIWKQELLANKKLALSKFNQKITEELGAPPSTRDEWIQDLFLMSPNPLNETRSKGFPKFRKK